MNHNSETLLDLENEVIDIVLSATQFLEKSWQSEKHIDFKKEQERVTQFDIQIEKEIRAKLSLLLPESGFFVEEGIDTDEKEYMWSIDPIDGTNNFIGNIPLFFTQIALVYKSEPILGVMFNSASGQLFSASKGNGARANKTKIIQKTVTEIQKALIDIDFGGSNGSIDWKLAIFKNLAEKCSRVRASGGGFGPYIAFGGIDAFVVLNEKTKIVDQMPRIIWARELGLQVEQFTISNNKVMLITNNALFPQLKRLIEKLSNIV